MASRRPKAYSIFLVRLWQEEGTGDQVEWCGRVHRSVNGEALSFQGWPGLAAALLSMLTPVEPTAAPSPLPDEEADG